MKKLTWRNYRLEDAAAVCALHVEQEQMLKQGMDLPDLMDRPVLWARVCEDENGKVVGAAYFEATVEFCMVGTDPEVTASLRREQPMVVGALQSRGLRVMRTLCPAGVGRVSKSVAKGLKRAGFVQTDGEYNHFILDLRQPESAASNAETEMVEAQASH